MQAMWQSIWEMVRLYMPKELLMELWLMTMQHTDRLLPYGVYYKKMFKIV